MYEPKDLSGMLFKNDRKQTEAQPDYKGVAMIGGQEFALSGWVKQSKTGGKYLRLAFTALAFTAKDAARPAVTTRTHALGSEEFDDAGRA